MLVYLVTGEAKAAAVKAAFADEPSPATPASLIRGRTTVAILDAAAASCSTLGLVLNQHKPSVRRPKPRR